MNLRLMNWLCIFLLYDYVMSVMRIILIIVCTGCQCFVSRAYQLSDDEEDTRRVVRSEKDKRYGLNMFWFAWHFVLICRALPSSPFLMYRCMFVLLIWVFPLFHPCSRFSVLCKFVINTLFNQIRLVTRRFPATLHLLSVSI